MLTSGRALLCGLRPGPARAQPPGAAGAGADLLREAQLTDVGFDPLTSVLCLVLDLRGALAFPEADVAVVVLGHVRGFAWSGPGTAQPFQPWYVVGSTVTRLELEHAVHLDLALLPAQRLTASAGSVELVVGRSRFYELAPPDLTSAAPAEVRLGFPRLETRFAGAGHYDLAAG